MNEPQAIPGSAAFPPPTAGSPLRLNADGSVEQPLTSVIIGVVALKITRIVGWVLTVIGGFGLGIVLGSKPHGATGDKWYEGATTAEDLASARAIWLVVFLIGLAIVAGAWLWIRYLARKHGFRWPNVAKMALGLVGVS